MMRPDAKVEKVHLYPKPVDFRKSSAIHEPHLLKDRASAYRGISGEQFHGSKAS